MTHPPSLWELRMSPLSLGWNTLETMVLQWNEVFRMVDMGNVGLKTA